MEPRDTRAQASRRLFLLAVVLVALGVAGFILGVIVGLAAIVLLVPVVFTLFALVLLAADGWRYLRESRR